MMHKGITEKESIMVRLAQAVYRLVPKVALSRPVTFLLVELLVDLKPDNEWPAGTTKEMPIDAIRPICGCSWLRARSTGPQAPSRYGNSPGFFVSAPLPIFNKNQGEIARSQQEIAQAGALAKAMEARIAGEAAAAWEHYTSTGQLLAEMEKDLLARAREVRSTMEYTYRRGDATLVEFPDAQRAFNDTVQSYNLTRADYARSLYLIDAVTAAAAAKQ